MFIICSNTASALVYYTKVYDIDDDENNGAAVL